MEHRLTRSRTPIVATAPGTLASSVLSVDTRGRGFLDLTADIRAFTRECGARHGLLYLFIRHTSASLTIQENADPDVLRDLEAALARLAPEDAPWRHAAEGPDDMPAHVKSMLTDVSLSIPVIDGEPALGTWQGVYLIEHRASPHRRQVVLQFMGDAG